MDSSGREQIVICARTYQSWYDNCLYKIRLKGFSCLTAEFLLTPLPDRWTEGTPASPVGVVELVYYN